METFHTIWLYKNYSVDTAGDCVLPRCNVCSKRGCTRKNHSKFERYVSALCQGKIGNKSISERQTWDNQWEESFNNPISDEAEKGITENE